MILVVNRALRVAEANDWFEALILATARSLAEPGEPYGIGRPGAFPAYVVCGGEILFRDTTNLNIIVGLRHARMWH